MRTLNIIMPMAGEGNRFKIEGWTTPKPLIMLKEVPLFQRAISSISADDIPTKYSFIVRQEHINEYHIDECIHKLFPKANVFSVNKTTRGAVESCLIAESVIEDNDAVIIMDCDIEFKSKALNDIIRNSLMSDSSTGGALISFESNEARYSYAAVDKKGFVIRTAEKEVISSHALCGAYFFASGRQFKEYAKTLLNESDFRKPEYYVSLLFNYLIADGYTVKLAEMEEYNSYGTPEELKRYL